MQGHTIRFVENLQARLTASDADCSIHDALVAELAAMQRPALLMVREAALDLARILELELVRRDDGTDVPSILPTPTTYELHGAHAHHYCSVACQHQHAATLPEPKLVTTESDADLVAGEVCDGCGVAL
jgi:ABC-type nickel/cobalt efflux system permease component RcnA